MRSYRNVAGLTAIALVISACAETPMGPHVAVMPAPNKPFEVFDQDKAICQQYAQAQVGGQAQSANNQAVGTAVVGTLLGAGLGAAIGGGHGAGIGAASGAVAGTAVGAGGSQHSQYGIQAQYDTAYSQCMYSRGNQVPGYYQPPAQSYAPQSGSYPPPPPAGYPPGPPPGY